VPCDARSGDDARGSQPCVSFASSFLLFPSAPPLSAGVRTPPARVALAPLRVARLEPDKKVNILSYVEIGNIIYSNLYKCANNQNFLFRKCYAQVRAKFPFWKCYAHPLWCERCATLTRGIKKYVFCFFAFPPQQKVALSKL
jgi:hypothetical protein